MADLIDNANIAAELINNYRGQAGGATTCVILPPGTTKIRDYMFYSFTNLEQIIMPESLEEIGHDAFASCINLKEINLPESLKKIDKQAFIYSGLTEIEIPHGVTSLGQGAFYGCTGLITAYLPNTVSILGNSPFPLCSNLEFLTLESGFNNSLDISVSTKYSATTLVNILIALADRSNQTAYTLTIGSINLNKLTAEQIAIATNKNWNLA